MHFNPNNKINQLCAKGMEMQKPAAAEALFLQAWNEATTNIKKFTAALCCKASIIVTIDSKFLFSNYIISLFISALQYKRAWQGTMPKVISPVT